MARGGARRRRSRTDGTNRAQSSDKKRLDGLWQNQVWWCNCEPRNEATLREVKKNSPNKGRWFWTCQTRACDFFLWREDAVMRETDPQPNPAIPGRAAIMVKQEPTTPPRPPAPTPRTPTLTQRPLTTWVQVSPGRSPGENPSGNSLDAADSNKALGGSSNTMTASRGDFGGSSSNNTMAASTPSASNKRSRDIFEDDDGEFSDFGSDDELQLANITDRSAEKPKRNNADAFTTPTSSRLIDADSGLVTPSVSRTLFTGPDPKRQKTVSFEDRTPLGLETPAKTPATSRTCLPSTLPSSSPGDAAAEADLVVDDVMALLRDQPVADAVLRSVRERLQRSALRTRGLALGRDKAREALRLKDDKIAGLQERVADLENKARFHGSQMTNIKANLMRMYQDN